MIILLTLPNFLYAQQKDREWHLTGDLYFAQNAKKGIGLGVKALFPVAKNDFITAGISFNLFQLKTTVNNVSENKKTFPLMAGYQHRFGNLYLEPQLGYGSYGGHFFYPLDARPSQGAVFLGAEGGYRINPFSFHLKFLSAHTSANEYLGKSFQYMGLGIAVNLSGGD